MYKVSAKKGTVSSHEENTMLFLTVLSFIFSAVITSLELCGDDNAFCVALFKNLLLGIISSALVSVVVVYVPYSSKKRKTVEKFYKDATRIYYTYNNVLNILLTTEEILYAAKKSNLESDSNSSFDILKFKKLIPGEIDKICSDIVNINNDFNSLEFTSKELEKIKSSVNNLIFPGAKLIGKLYDSMCIMAPESFYKPDLYPSIICCFTKKIYDITNTKYPYTKVHSDFKGITDQKTQNDFFERNFNDANTHFINSMEGFQIDFNIFAALTDFDTFVIEFTRDLNKESYENMNNEYGNDSNNKKQTDSEDK